MAENDQDNEEYQFGDFDNVENESMEESPEGARPELSADGGEKKNIRRNALIVVGIVIVLYILYKIIGAFYGGPKEPVKPAIPPITQQAVPQPVQPEIIAPTPPPTIVKETDGELKQKVSNIEINEQNIKSDVSSLKDQVTTVDTNVSNLTAQISKLSQAVSDLSDQLSKQSLVITQLTARAKVKRVKPKILIPIEVITYNIQAVIPGRAWLIASNGSTLTVREGTIIPGYGMVKLIDSIQGRVLTSSGRIIRFSQNDS